MRSALYRRVRAVEEKAFKNAPDPFEPLTDEEIVERIRQIDTMFEALEKSNPDHPDVLEWRRGMERDRMRAEEEAKEEPWQRYSEAASRSWSERRA